MADALPIPVIPGETISLRAHRASDADAVYERSVDPVTQEFTTVPRPYTHEMAVEYVTGFTTPSPDQICWAIDVDGFCAGSIDLRVLSAEARAGSLGFAVHPAHRGRGVMSEAVRLVVGHAFDDLGWSAVRWEAHAGNWGSLKAVWRNGFPTPVYVPDLLVERGGLIDGWISTLHAGAPREPVAPWEQVRERAAASLPAGRS